MTFPGNLPYDRDIPVSSSVGRESGTNSDQFRFVELNPSLNQVFVFFSHNLPFDLS